MFGFSFFSLVDGGEDGGCGLISTEPSHKHHHSPSPETQVGHKKQQSTGTATTPTDSTASTIGAGAGAGTEAMIEAPSTEVPTSPTKSTT